MKNCGGTREISGSANKTAQMEADWTYTEEGIPLPQRNKLRVRTLQGQCSKGRLSRSWRRIIQEEAERVRKTQDISQGSRWKHSTGTAS